MNKYQEALDYLASLWEIEGEITVTSDPFDRFNRVETLVEDRVRRADRGNVKLLQELVDKETPKKPNKIVEEKYEWYDVFDGLRCFCPNCNCELCIPFATESNTRCNCCGQVIDWSDVHDR